MVLPLSFKDSDLLFRADVVLGLLQGNSQYDKVKDSNPLEEEFEK